MYEACSTMNNKIMFSGTYDIVYLEGSNTHRVSMAWLRKNGYAVVLMDEAFNTSYETTSSECQFDYGTNKCKNEVCLVMAPERENDFLVFSTCSMASSLAGPAAFRLVLSAITNGGLASLERKLRGLSGIDIIGPGNLYMLLMCGTGNVESRVLRDILDSRFSVCLSSFNLSLFLPCLSTCFHIITP